MTARPRPQTSTYRVDDLVEMVLRGKIRVPEFRHGFRWTVGDVVALFESIHFGFPIGALLFQRKPAAAGMYWIGPLHILGPELDAALWIIDGQQRLLSIAVALGRPTPIPSTPVDPWVVYFDPVAQRFCSPPSTGVPSDAWVPITAMRSTQSFMDWALDWPYASERELLDTVNEAMVRIRDYSVPASIIDVDDPAVLGEIFLRVNAFGKTLDPVEIFDALANSTAAQVPTRLDTSADALATIGMGRPDEQQLLRWVAACEGLDATKKIDLIVRDDATSLALAATLPTVRRMLSFLGTQAGIPHLRLVPHFAPLTILTRFFHLHPHSSSRSRELLVRWFWRSMLTLPSGEARAFQRRGVADIDDDEEGSVQRLLGALPKHMQPLQLPERFDVRTIQTRLVMLGLCALVPRDLATGMPLDVAATVEAGVWRRIVTDGSKLAKSPANRLILPGTNLARSELLEVTARSDASAILESHAITDEALQALRADEHERFLRLRAKTLETQANAHAAAMADWQGNDRPSLDYIIRHVAGVAAHDEGV